VGRGLAGLHKLVQAAHGRAKEGRDDRLIPWALKRQRLGIENMSGSMLTPFNVTDSTAAFMEHRRNAASTILTRFVRIVRIGLRRHAAPHGATVRGNMERRGEYV